VVPDIVHYVLVVLTVLAAIWAAEAKDLTRAIVAFTSMSVLLSIIFYLLGAPYVAVFQLSVYAAAVTVLFVAALHTIGRKTE